MNLRNLEFGERISLSLLRVFLLGFGNRVVIKKGGDTPAMATSARCTPHNVGTGQETEEAETQILEAPSSSSSRPNRGEGVCLVCALGTKGSHTYQRECKKYVVGTTLEQMKKAARGRRNHRLLLELALQRQDAEQEMEAAQERSRPPRREAAPASSSSSSTTSPSPRRKRQKRTRDQRDLVPTKPEPQQKEEKIDAAVNTTGKEKRNEIQQVTMDRDESPDMVDEILGRTASSRQAKTDMRTKEESCATKHIQSGNTKRKCKQQENTEREEKKKVPPPPSARVDESRIDEEAVARLEEARLKRIREESDKMKENKDNSDTAKLKADEEQRKAQQSQPLTPWLPREESLIGDGSTTEEVEDDKLEQDTRAEPHDRPTQLSEAWHKNTRPAEPRMTKKWQASEPRPRLEGEQTQLKLDQLAYLAMWLKEDDETRRFWEGRQPDLEEDIARLAREMQTTDLQLGQGATAQCIASRLTEWGYEEVLGEPAQEKAPGTVYSGTNSYK